MHNAPPIDDRHGIPALLSSIVELIAAKLPLAVELDGHLLAAPRQHPARYTLQIASREALLRLLSRPDLGRLAEAYVEGDWDLVGDLEAALRDGEDLVASLEAHQLAAALAAPAALAGLPTGGSASPAGDLPDPPPAAPQPASDAERARRAISYHYDLPVEFWRLWLDDNLLYTCGYHRTPEDDVHTAQRQKMARVAAKLRITPDSRVLDIGCGWGGFLIHAAGLGAHATGITLSELQAVEARRRIAAAGLTSRCTVEHCDFRDHRAEAGFDACVALGIIEHLGAARYPAFFEKAYAALRPGGLLLVQAIAVAEHAEFGSSTDFIRDRVFPEATLESVGTMLLHAERAKFEVCDVESLRNHYILTLRQWRSRLEHNAAAAIELVGRARYRVFRAYLAGFANEFRKARLTVYQVLLHKPGPVSRLSLVRV